MQSLSTNGAIISAPEPFANPEFKLDFPTAPAPASTDDFLALLFPDPDEPFVVSLLAAGETPDEPDAAASAEEKARYEAHNPSFEAWAASQDIIFEQERRRLITRRELQTRKGCYSELTQHNNNGWRVYLAPNALDGSGTKPTSHGPRPQRADNLVIGLNALFADFDAGSLEEQKARLDECAAAWGMPTTARIWTGGRSLHPYWMLYDEETGLAPRATPENLAMWRELQTRLVYYFGSDRSIIKPAQLLALPGFHHEKLDYYANQVKLGGIAAVQSIEPNCRYTLQQALDCIPPIPDEEKAARAGTAPKQGSARALVSFNGTLPLAPGPLTPGCGITSLNDFNERGGHEVIQALLGANGWKYLRDSHKGEEWMRPNQTRTARSGGILFADRAQFYPITDATSLAPDRAYSPVDLASHYTGLSGSDLARELGKLGWGDPAKRQPEEQELKAEQRKAQAQAQGARPLTTVEADQTKLTSAARGQVAAQPVEETLENETVEHFDIWVGGPHFLMDERGLRQKIRIANKKAKSDEARAEDATAEEEEEEGKFRYVNICAPFNITARVRNHEQNSWGKLLRFPDHDGIWHGVVIDDETLAGDGKEYRMRLASEGLTINPTSEARRAMQIFLTGYAPSRTARRADATGWSRDAKSFIFPDATIRAEDTEAEDVIFQPTGAAGNLFKFKGTAEDWRDNIGKYCRGNSRLLFSVSLALAAPLLDITGAESGGVHWDGSSTKGKSTVGYVAGSVWGGTGTKNGYSRSWRSTANGLEGVALSHNDTFMLLDEIALADPRTVGETAYMLGNGQAKQRANRDGGARNVTSFKLLYLSTGEISPAQMMAQGGKQIRGGQEVRLLTLPSVVSEKLGLFEELHGFAGPKEFAEHLGDMARYKYYGTTARAFVADIINNRAQIVANYQAAMNWLQDDILKRAPGASSEILRASNRFALIAVAGEHATSLGLTGWERHDAAKAAQRLMWEWIEARGGLNATDAHVAIKRVRDFVEKHGSARFEHESFVPPTVPGQLVEMPDMAESNKLTINRAGILKTINGQEFYCFNNVGFAEACGELLPSTVAGYLLAAGLLKAQKGRNLNIKIKGHHGRFYAVPATILEWGSETANSESVTPEEF